MKVDLLHRESWDRANSQLTRAWPHQPEERLQIHRGLSTGIFETAIGLAQLFSHKKSVAFVKGMTWAFDGITPWFLKEAYKVQTAKWNELDTPEKQIAWVETLAKDTVFAAIPEDHPVTGATWDFSALEKKLNDAKIVVLRVSHSSFLVPAAPALPYSCRFCSVDSDEAFSIAGARVRAPAFLSPGFSWNDADIGKALGRRLEGVADRAAVEGFEAKFSAERFLAPGIPRIFDRAVLNFRDLGGDLLVRTLRSKHPGISAEQLATTHLCHHNAFQLYKGWWQPLPEPNDLRGLVIFGAAAIKKPNFAESVNSAVKELRSRQSW